MLAKDNMPLNTVEKEGFVAFVKCLASRYPIPSRKTITTLMTEKYNYLSDLIKQELRNIKNIALTADIWTDINTRSYLGVTAHYCINGKKKNLMIGVTKLNERHTSQNLKEILLKIVDSWNISKDSIVVVVTDNASNITRAVTEAFGAEKQLGCYAHTLNLVVSKVLTENETAKRLCKEIKSVVTTFKRSVPLSDELAQNSTLKLIQDVETRWNSIYDMLERFVELVEIIRMIIWKHGNMEIVKIPTPLEVDYIKEIIQLLRPFKEATTILSGEAYVTGSEIIPVKYILIDTLKSCQPVSEVGYRMKEALIRELKDRFASIEDNPLLAIATILDPRYKKEYFENKVSCSGAINNITRILKKNSRDLNITQEENVDSASEVQESGFWGGHSRVIATAKRKFAAKSSGNDMPKQFQSYLDEPPIKRDKCPLQYWQCHSDITLASLAEKYLTVLATSVASERLFSRAGNIMTDLRNRLSSIHLQQLLFLHSLPREDWHLENNSK